MNKERRQVFMSVLLADLAEIGHTDPMLAIDVAYGMYAAVVRGGLVFGERHELQHDMSDRTVVQELKRALLSTFAARRLPNSDASAPWTRWPE